MVTTLWYLLSTSESNLAAVDRYLSHWVRVVRVNQVTSLHQAVQDALDARMVPPVKVDRTSQGAWASTQALDFGNLDLKHGEGLCHQYQRSLLALSSVRV